MENLIFKVLSVFPVILFWTMQVALAQIFPDENWTPKPLQELGFNIKRFEAMEDSLSSDLFGEIHSVIVIKDGYLSYEKYFNGWHRDSLQSMQSITKSIISTYTGIALQNVYLDSLNTLIQPIFEKEFEIEHHSSNKKAIRVHDLLTMQSGFKWIEKGWNDPDNIWREILEFEGNWYKKVMDLPVPAKPGTLFQYQNGNPTLITGLIQQISGRPIQEFAEEYLFNQLSISPYDFWQGNGGPEHNGHALIYMRPVDLAKIGYLFLNEGRWKSKQLIPEWYVEEATFPQIKNAEENPFYKYDYGYFWWVNPTSKNDGWLTPNGSLFMARGAGGQNLIVWPEEKLVCVITAWNLQRPNITQTIFERFIVPAVQSKNKN